MAGATPDLLMEAALGYQHTAAIRAAIELDLFSAIARGETSAEALARSTGAAIRGIRILCDYLTVRGHLEKHDGAYRLTPSSAAFLDRASPAWTGSVVEYLAAPDMIGLFLRDPASFVRNGGSLGLANNAPDHPIWVTFARAMAPSRAPVAAKVAAILAPRSPRRVLDVAAGHGMFGVAVAQAVPGAEITAVDWQAVLSVAQETAAAAGVSARYGTLAGSAFDVDWGSGFDLALLANVLHQFDRADCIALLRKVGASLAPGGCTAVIEMVPGEDRVSPPFPAAFAFQMLGSTPGGDAYTAREFEAMGEAAGFARLTVSALPPSPQSLLVFERHG